MTLTTNPTAATRCSSPRFSNPPSKATSQWPKSVSLNSNARPVRDSTIKQSPKNMCWMRIPRLIRHAKPWLSALVSSRRSSIPRLPAAAPQLDQVKGYVEHETSHKHSDENNVEPAHGEHSEGRLGRRLGVNLCLYEIFVRVGMAAAAGAYDVFG